MTTADNHERLARAYGGLLRVYPRRYRIHRHDEMLSTLLDGATPDRRRPTAREIVDLVTGGLRCHLQIPRGVGYQLIGVVLALVVGLVTGAAATWLAWSTAAERISPAAAAAVARTAIPREPAAAAAYQDPLSLTFLHETGSAEDSVAEAPDLPRIEFQYPVDDVSAAIAMLAEARQRLIADDWRAGHLEENSASGFWATSGDTRVWIGYYWVGSQQGARQGVALAVHDTLPALVPAAGLAGLLFGMTAGWLWAGWVVRRYQRHVPAARATMVIAGGPVLLLGLAVAVTTIGYAVALAIGEGWSPTDPIRIASTLLRPLPSLTLILVGLLALSALAARAPRSPERGEPMRGDQVLRYSARAVAAAHLLIATGYGVIVLWYLRTLYLTGDYDGMQRLAYDPNAWVPLGTSPLNPVRWLLVPAQLSFLVGWLMSPALLAISLPLLGFSWKSLGRTTRWVLVVAALTAVALPMVSFSQLGQDVGGWLVD